MAVELRFSRGGVRGRPFYRMVAVERASKRDGRRIELLGTYSPLTNPPSVKLKEDRVRRWIEVGAQYTTTARRIIMKAIPGIIETREKRQRDRIVSERKKRKARLAGKGKKAKK